MQQWRRKKPFLFTPLTNVIWMNLILFGYIFIVNDCGNVNNSQSTKKKRIRHSIRLAAFVCSQFIRFSVGFPPKNWIFKLNFVSFEETVEKIQVFSLSSMKHCREKPRWKRQIMLIWLCGTDKLARKSNPVTLYNQLIEKIKTESSQ